MSDNDSSSNNSQGTNQEDERFFALLSDQDRYQIWERMLARPERKEAPGPLSDFDRNFQEHVPVKLLNLITALAPMVQLEVYGFAEACDAVWRTARKYGADYLSQAAEHSWHEWIASELVARIGDPLPDHLVTPERLTKITGEK